MASLFFTEITTDVFYGTRLARKKIIRMETAIEESTNSDEESETKCTDDSNEAEAIQINNAEIEQDFFSEDVVQIDSNCSVYPASKSLMTIRHCSILGLKQTIIRYLYNFRQKDFSLMNLLQLKSSNLNQVIIFFVIYSLY